MTPSPAPQQVEAMRERIANGMRTDWAASAVRRATDEWVIAQVRSQPGGITAFLNDYEERGA